MQVVAELMVGIGVVQHGFLVDQHLRLCESRET